MGCDGVDMGELGGGWAGGEKILSTSGRARPVSMAGNFFMGYRFIPIFIN